MTKSHSFSNSALIIATLIYISGCKSELTFNVSKLDEFCLQDDSSLEKVSSDVKLLKCDGTVVTGKLETCSEGSANCLMSQDQVAIQPEQISKVLPSGSVYAGITGENSDIFPNPEHVLITSSTNGVTGSIGFCDESLSEQCLATSDMPAFGLPEATDLRQSVRMGSVTGTIKTNCKNLADLTTFDNINPPAIVGLDPYDNIDSFLVVPRLITENPWSTDNSCLPADLSSSVSSWEKAETTVVENGSGTIFFNHISKTQWTRGDDTSLREWDENIGGVGNGALNYCDELVHGGIENWRVPTQKELLLAYIHGIYALDDDFRLDGDHLGDLDLEYVWTSTTKGSLTGQAWAVFLNDGFTRFRPKNSSFQILCISP